jgi:branched-chain amino acid transport system substrate-binding protein
MRTRLVAGIAIAVALVLPRATPAQNAPLKIGLVMKLSGNGASMARSVSASIDAYFALHGGATLGGRPVAIIRRDDTEVPEVGRRQAQELVVQEHVDILMGGTAAPESAAIAEISTQAKVPYFIINATTPGLLTKAPYAVRTAALAADLSPPLASWAVRNGLKTVYAVVADYSTGRDKVAALTTALEAAGGKMIGSVAAPQMTTDFSSYMLRVKDAKPDAVFCFFGSAPGSINVIRQFAVAGLKATTKMIGGGDLTAEELLPAEGDDALGIVTVSNYTVDHDSKLNRDFVRAYRAAIANPKPDDGPSFVDVQAYDALAAIDRAIGAQKGAIDANRTMEVLRGVTFESPRGTISIDPLTREVHQSIYIRRVERRNGRLANVEIAAFPPSK